MQQDIDRSVAHTQSRPWHISPWIVIGLFGLLLFTPAAVQLFFAGGSGQSENRVLAPFPTVGSIKSLSLFSRRLENYINDHFGLRDQLVRTNIQLFCTKIPAVSCL